MSAARRPRTRIRPPKSRTTGLHTQHTSILTTPTPVTLVASHSESQVARTENFSSTWPILARVIQDTYAYNTANLSYEELYRNAYTIVVQQEGPRLYDAIQSLLRNLLRHCVRTRVLHEENVPPPTLTADLLSTGSNEPVIAESTPDPTGYRQLDPAIVDTDDLVAAVSKLWTDHRTCLEVTRKVFMYMDRIYCPAANLPPTYNLGLTIFREEVLKYPSYPVEAGILHYILEQIRREREGESIDRDTLRNVMGMLRDLPSTTQRYAPSTYLTAAEPALVEATAQYYAARGHVWVQTNDSPQMLHHIEAALAQEQRRCEDYLPMETYAKLRAVIERDLVTTYGEQLLKMPNGLVDMFDRDRRSDMKLLYDILSPVPTCLAMMKAEGAAHILHIGELINQKHSTERLKAAAVVTPRQALPASSGTSTSATDGAEAPPSPTQWVQAVLDLMQRWATILTECFAGNGTFEAEFYRSFSAFINRHPRAAEFLSLYMDEQLTKNAPRRVTTAVTDAPPADDETMAERVLEQTIGVFRLLYDKDVFERYYKQHLAKRLLLDRSLSDELERRTVARLKVEVGQQFTTKLEGMFNDMRLSRDTNRDFSVYCEADSAATPAYRLQVQVLTASCWPTPSAPPGSLLHVPTTGETATVAAKSSTESTAAVTTTGDGSTTGPVAVILQTELMSGAKAFSDFYASRHSGRRLTWQMNAGSADLRCQFQGKRYVLNVATFQMLALLCFNGVAEDQTLTFKDIQRETGILEYELRRSLRSLACGKYRLLVKEPKSNDIDPTTDRFRVNEKFSSPQARLKIRPAATSGSQPFRSDGSGRSASTVADGTTDSTAVASLPDGNAAETEAEERETKARVNENRKNLIEATIVRLMKSHKKLDHNNLLAEVTQQLQPRFTADPAMIKQRIEVLIDREYMERSPDDRRVYLYLA
ncbi:hypothetical protein IWQ60_007432 [Tieghemiomyces parasiticus]|uniref:Cullin family profile domain-containing protein n=1 Tax=Tieghemiomyces parasiticus TaxID=78921 RepID=A0A9W8A161_9FUNG|nr:hypothetical protein IWQ60_007432 [Tieghemiomyces parasiticus]